MSQLPTHLRQISLFLERLPGIGAKSANRLAYFFLRLPESDLQNFASHVMRLKSETKYCSNCYNLTETEMCEICTDPDRNQGLITVVENVLDLLSFETGNINKGVYHVLHGRIDPLNHMTPDDIFLPQLLDRVKKMGDKVEEIILATNPNMEGEATAMYIRARLEEVKKDLNLTFKISRLGYGLPIGAHLEYADYMTLGKAIENRNQY